MASTEQSIAHLERGWDRFQQGDFIGAERSARALLELSANDPEALCLLGAILGAQGRPEEALRCYRDAMSEDNTNPEPILGAAELALRAFSDPEECARLCDLALAAAQEPESQADAALLKIEALLLLGERPEAQILLREVPEDLDSPALLLRLGRLCGDLGRQDDAERHLRAAIAREPRFADAHYELGLVLGDLGREQEARELLLSTYLLDAERVPLRQLSAKQIQEMAERVRAGLPPGIRALLGGAPFLVAPRIGAELVGEGFDPRSSCYFAGQPASFEEDQPAQLERIFLYHQPILSFARNPSAIEGELRAALLAEVAQFFALSDRELADRGVSPEEL